jgi:tripartite-type tricarboxylate transporter receptor subunit TctC
MKLPRRKFLHLAAGAAALPAISRFARAQAYPTRPVRIIVGFAPGGAFDIMARLIGQWLSERLGQPFVIENRPGGGGNIGTEAVVRAPADGYTLLLVGVPNAINATLYQKLNFNFIRDIAPVAGIDREPQVMVVNPSVPAKTVPEFVAYAKAHPGKISMASQQSARSDDWNVCARWYAPASAPQPQSIQLVAGRAQKSRRHVRILSFCVREPWQILADGKASSPSAKAGGELDARRRCHGPQYLASKKNLKSPIKKLKC